MNGRTAGILTTSVAAIMCGCPGILMLCGGAVLAFASFIPGAQLELPSDNSPRSTLALGLSALCLGTILIAIPLVVGLLSLRNRPQLVLVPEEALYPGVPAEPSPPEEPLPPAS